MSAAPDPNTQLNSPEDLNFQQILYDKLKTRKHFKHSLLHLCFTKQYHVALNSYFCYYGFVVSFLCYELRTVRYRTCCVEFRKGFPPPYQNSWQKCTHVDRKHIRYPYTNPLRNTQWIPYVPPDLTFSNSTFCPHSEYVFCVDLRKIAMIIYLYGTNWLVFIIKV
jgi:hypothetical protein